MEGNGNGHGKPIEAKLDPKRTDAEIVADLMLVLVYVGNECREIAKHLLILEEAVKRAVENLKEEGK
jgi:transposase